MGLIEKNDNGSWKLKGVGWSQIKPGAVITVQVWEELYGALWKLKDYEETGLMPDKVLELNEETQEQARAMLKRVARLSDEIEQMKGEERQQWIPVTERLPEPETIYWFRLIIIHSRILRPIELMMTVAEHFTRGMRIIRIFPWDFM